MEKNIILRTIKNWNKLPREALESLCLVLSKIYLVLPCFEIQRFPSDLDDFIFGGP